MFFIFNINFQGYTEKVFMIKKLTIGTLFLLFASIFTAPASIAQTSEEPNDTRIEKYEDLTETEVDPSNGEAEESSDTAQSESDDGIQEPETRTEEKLEEYNSDDTGSYDVRRTEAFNLVSSAYRGDFEDQGINSYATLISNYEAGELTAEDLIEAAIESGELSPNAIEDDSYVEAVDSQLDALTSN